MFAGQVGITGHIKIADGTKIGAQSGVTGDIKNENSILLGSPAIDHREFLKSSVIFKKLPEIRATLIKMEKELDALKKAK
jgi:UDP-3-O-[3-hydroxymyristoyl] glucosamine N-acyltransferase